MAQKDKQLNFDTFFRRRMRKLLRLMALVLLIGSTLTYTGCVQKRKMVYLQTDADGAPIDSIAFTYNRADYRLQVNDIVDVKVYSPEKSVSEFFNFSQGGTNQQNMQVGVQSGGDLYYMTGYSVNDSGNIVLPVLGNVPAVGLNIEELKARIKESLDVYLKEYHLEVKLGGIRYTALGEFARPGKFVLLQNQATIYEAIANAGDLTMVASRGDVRLIRQYPTGTRVHTLNLLDESIINSPYYFIQPNDVIYVEPLKVKSWGIGVTGAQTLTTILSVVSSSLALILAFDALSNNN